MRMAATALRSLALLAAIVAYTAHSFALPLNTHTATDNNAVEDAVSLRSLTTTIAIDLHGDSSAVLEATSVQAEHDVFLHVAVERVQVKSREETQLVGLTLRESSEPTMEFDSRLLSSHRRYRLRLSTSAGELRLLPTIHTFLGPLLHITPATSGDSGTIIQLDGPTEHVNVALRSLLYTAHAHQRDDEIAVELDPIEPTSTQKRLYYRLPVVVSRPDAEPFQVQWNEQPLNNTVVIHVDEDTVIPLGNLSIAKPPLLDMDKRDLQAMIVNVTLAASHGRLQINDSFTSATESIQVMASDDIAIQITGSVRAINDRLSTFVYSPFRNYNGPDTIVISIAPASAAESYDVIAGSDLLQVFLRPIADGIQLEWTDTRSSTLNITSRGSGIAQSLPALHIEDDDDDQEDDKERNPASLPFFKYRGYLRALVQVTQESGLDLRHDAVATQRISNGDNSTDTVQLQFEGRASDLMTMLMDIQLLPLRLSKDIKPSTASDLPIAVVVRVAKVHATNGSAYMPVEARLYVDRTEDLQTQQDDGADDDEDATLSLSLADDASVLETDETSQINASTNDLDASVGILSTTMASVIAIASEIPSVTFRGDVPAHQLLRINESSIGPEDTEVLMTLRLSALKGSFETVNEPDRLGASCGKSVERRLLADDESDWLSSIRIVRELRGRLECLPTLLQRTVYRSSSSLIPTTTSSDTITVELWHANRMLSTHSFTLELLPQKPRFVLNVVDISSNSSTSESTVWRWIRGRHVPLHSLVGAISITLSPELVDQEGDHNPAVLSLTVSCSSSCVLSYDQTTRPLVPHVDYTLAAAMTPTLRFFGTRTSLSELLQTLEISAAVDTSSRSSSGSNTSSPASPTVRHGQVELSLAETQASLYYAGVVDTARIPFRFTVVDAPLRWLVQRSEYQASSRSGSSVDGRGRGSYGGGVALVDGIRLATESRDLARDVRVVITCEGKGDDRGDVMVSIDQPQARQRVDRKCSPSEWIEINGTIAQLNAALATVQVRSQRDQVATMVFAAVDDAEQDERTHVQVTVVFGGNGRQLTGRVATASPRLVATTTGAPLAVNESTVVRVGELFAIDDDDDDAGDPHELYQLTAVVAQGELVVPLGQVCCIHVKSALSTARLEMEGTLHALRDALAQVLYTPRASFWGDDQLRITIEDELVSSQLDNERWRWSSETAIRILPVNHAPRVSIQQLERKRVSFMANDSIAMYQTVVSITIADNDIEHLPMEVRNSEDEINGSVVRVRLVVSSGVSNLVLPQWKAIEHSVSDVEVIKSQVTVSGHTTEDAGLVVSSSLTFDAPLLAANALLSSVLLNSQSNTPTSSTCDDEDEGDDALLTVYVSDLGHNVSGWPAQETTQRVRDCDMSDVRGDASSDWLTLSLPADHAALDLTTRSLTVSGLRLAESWGEDHDDDDESMVRVTGATAVRVVPEVQRIRLVGPKHMQLLTVKIQVSAADPDLDIASLGGDFELHVAGNPARTTSVYAQAVAMRLNEVMGDDGTGRGPNESMEAHLNTLYGAEQLHQHQIHVVKNIQRDKRAVTWQIYAVIASGARELAPFSFGATAFVGVVESPSVSVTSETYGGSLDGVFSLQLGQEITRALSVHAEAVVIQNALEELPSIGVVQVASVNVFTWDVTFFQPGANVPLLTANSSMLTPVAVTSDAAWPTITSMGTAMEISRLRRGHGQGALYQIEIDAIPVSPVYRIHASQASATLGGGRFTLGFRTGSAADVVAVTTDIAVDAVAEVQDEGVLHHAGGRVGSSVQSKLRAAIQQLPLDHWRSESIQVKVTRSQITAVPPAYAWTITFVNAPSDFPLLVSGEATGTGSGVSLTVQTITPANSVGGFFSLSVNGYETRPIAVSASADVVEETLNALPSVHHGALSSAEAFGRVLVRKRELLAVGGASFAVLFTEQVASLSSSTSQFDRAHESLRVTADGAQLTGLGAFARVIATVDEAKDAQENNVAWFFPAFDGSSVLPMETETPRWMNTVRGVFRRHHFEVVGKLSHLQPLLRQFTYTLPSDWCCGDVGVRMRAERVSDGSDLVTGIRAALDVAVVQTDLQRVPWVAPRHVVIVRRNAVDKSDDNGDDDVVVVTRGASGSVGVLRVDAPPPWSSSCALLWMISVCARVQHGALALRTVATHGVIDNGSNNEFHEVWVNGTTQAVNAKLLRLEYTSSLSSSHVVDVLSAEVYSTQHSDADDANHRLVPTATGAFLIRIQEPPVEPRIAITPQADQLISDDGLVVLVARDDEPLAIHGISIVDANREEQPSIQSGHATLTLQAELGRVFFTSSIDGLPPPVQEGQQLRLHGDMNALNDALRYSLRYESSSEFAQTRDTLTLQVTHHPRDRPVLTHTLSLRIEIRHAVHVPRVVVANGSTVAYASKEDNGYQFPKLTLVDDHTGPRQLSDASQSTATRRKQRRSVVELRRTDLQPPLVNSGTQTDDWRHRWVADFPILSQRVTTASALAAMSGSSGAFFFLTGSDRTHGEELWISDGSSNGTTLFLDLMPGDASSSPSDFAVLPSSTSKLVFAADGIDRSWILETETLCNRERLSSSHQDIQYVVAQTTTWDPAAQYDCPQRGWRWATTADARARFRDTGSGSRESTNLSEEYVFWDSCDWSGYTFGGAVRKFFRFADSHVTGAYKHAGRRDAASVEVSFATTEFAGIVCVRDATNSNNTNSVAGRELWIADAAASRRAHTAARRLMDIESGPRGSDPRFLTAFQNKWILFQATTLALGAELYRTDGTRSGTTLVEDIWSGPRSASPSDFAEWTSSGGGDGRLYFAATSDSGRELWSTDGLSSLVASERGRRGSPTTSGLLIGTALVRDICAGGASSDPQFLTPMGSQGVFFAASDCVHGRELWVTDGTIAGTKMVKDINPTPNAGSSPSHLVAFNGKLYFAATANAVASGRELFVSDGTASGTTLLVEIAGGVANARPTTLTVASSTRLFFHAMDDGIGQGNLWSSDGSVGSGGTSRVWDAVFAQSHGLRLADTSGRSDRFFVFNNAVYYFVEKKLLNVESDPDAEQLLSADDAFQLEISVNHGTLYLPFSSSNQSLSSSLIVEGSRRHLQDVLRRLLYQPPLNWNALQTPGDHVVQWRFTVSSPSSTSSNSTTSTTTTTTTATTTTADLLVRPQLDPPVIIVPLAVEHATDSARDYLSRLRLECLPITVLEDVPTFLRGFSVRGVDDHVGDDGGLTSSWQLELSVARGRLDVIDATGCVKRVLVGQLSGTRRVRLVASRVSCLQRLLRSVVYTSDPHMSGVDALHIRVVVGSEVTTAMAHARGNQDDAIVPIHVTELNDAPYLTSLSGFFYESDEDHALVIRDLRVVDPDAAVISVDLSVRFGSVSFLYDFDTNQASSSIRVTTKESSDASSSSFSRLVFTGTLKDVNAVLSSVAYTSAKDWNSLAQIPLDGGLEEDGYDVVTVELSDGQRFNASTTTELFVYVAPTPDPVVIHPPVVLSTSVFASAVLEDENNAHDGVGGSDVLHGYEDLWLETESLGFTTVDDTARLSLEVTVRVGHGRLAFEEMTLHAVTTTSSTDVDGGRSWRLRGRLALVNRTVATLRYLPDKDFYGHDELEIVATAGDVYVPQQSITTTRIVAIEIHAVNDASRWTLPSSTVHWTQDAPTKITGVMLDDVDFQWVECGVDGQCALDVVVETTASGLLTFPRLKDLLTTSPTFSVSTTAQQATSYIALSGSVAELNVVLSEIVLTTSDTASLVREPVEIWFSADDRGTFGSGGPLVSRTRLVVLPFQWTSHPVELLTPTDDVLTTDEDTPLVFPGASIRLKDTDASSRPISDSPQYEVSIEQSHGTFRLVATTPTATTRLLVLPPSSSSASGGADGGRRGLKFRGFLPQINAALDGSAYVPDADWFGADQIRILVRELSDSRISETSTVASAVVAVFVTPVCDEPRWHKTTVSTITVEPTDLELEEDQQALLNTLSIVDPDTIYQSEEETETHRDVSVSIDVLDGGGVMLATTRGLRLTNEQSPTQWTTAATSSLRLLFFSTLTLTGRATDLNAALRGLIYRPEPDFHTNGHVRDAIILTLLVTNSSMSSSASSCVASISPPTVVIRARVHAVNDAPLVISSRFTRVFNRHELDLDVSDLMLRLGLNNDTLEATEDEELRLDAITLFDADTLDDRANDGTESRSSDANVRLRVVCRYCTVHSSLGLETLQRDHSVFVSRDDAASTTAGTTTTTTTTATTYYGSMASLNTALLASLVFTSARHFHGHALVELEIADLGFYGRGGPLQSTFVMAVRVHSVNDRPQIHAPPYGTRAPPLIVDENTSVLLRGAPDLILRDQQPTVNRTRTQQLMFVNPLASTSTTRQRSLLDTTELTSFYTSLSPQQLLFSASRDSVSGVELWTSDGTASGTRLLKDIAPGAHSSHPQYLTPPFSRDGRVYFAARGPNTDTWRLRVDRRDQCDGMRESVFTAGVFYVVAAQTTWDTRAVYDCPVGLQWMTTAEAQRVFVGTVATDGHRDEPLVYYSQCGWQAYEWGGSGQQRTHFRFADSHTTGAFKHAGHRDSYRPDVGFQTAEFGGVVCRRPTPAEQQHDDDNQKWSGELWATDGTTEGTLQVTRVGSSTLPAFVTEFRGRLFFQATTLAFGTELWASDGTRDGTQLIADVAFGPRSSSPEQLTVVNDKLFFSASTEATGRELWVSDGEPRSEFAQVDHGATSTRLVLDLWAGPQSSIPLFLVALPSSGLLLFQANDGIHGAELWASDGSSAGTALVADIYTGAQSSSPQFLTHFGGRVYFQADDGIHGAELWTTDGTAANTHLLVDLAAGSSSARPRFFTVLSLPGSVAGGAASLVFAASTDRDPHVVEFWISDGTASGGGTRRLFAGSREVATLNEEAKRALHSPQFAAVGDGFVYFGREPPQRQRQGSTSQSEERTTAVVTRSLTLVDDGSDDGGGGGGGSRNYTVTLQCGVGALSLSRRLACAGVAHQEQEGEQEPSAQLQLRGSLSHLNCLVAEIVYHATPIRSGSGGGDWDDAIEVTLTEEVPDDSHGSYGDGKGDDDGRVYVVTQRIRVRVMARNHAPVVGMPSRAFASLNQWMPLLLSSAHVSDIDAGDDAMLFVRLTARRGRVRLVDLDRGEQEDSMLLLLPSLPVDPQRGSVAIEFSATATRATRLLQRHVEYACLHVDGCVADGVHDTLTLLVDDNGFSGSGGPLATTTTTTVVVVAEA